MHLAAPRHLGDDAASERITWRIVLGVGMRLTLHDAAFAALARIGGPEARRAMSGITLLGGLAATVFWPLGRYPARSISAGGSRCWPMPGFALLTIPLHLTDPERAASLGSPSTGGGGAAAASARRHAAAARGGGRALCRHHDRSQLPQRRMSAHMIAVLSGLGLTVTVAVWIARLRGIGQSAARLCDPVRQAARSGRARSPHRLA